MRRLWVLVMMSGLCLSGCAKPFVVPVPMKHVVMFDSDGTAVNPEGNAGPGQHSIFGSYDQYTKKQYEEHINKILEEIEQAGPPGGKRKIMMFIHGGMNTQVGSLERLVEPFLEGEKKTRIDYMKDHGYYPIFINWKSSLWSSYFEHLFYIRQGQRWAWLGWPTALVVFSIDVTRSLVRAPLAWGMQMFNDSLSIPWIAKSLSPTLHDESRNFNDEVSAELLCRYNLEGPLKTCVEQLHFKKPPSCLPWAIEATPNPFRPDTREVSADTFPIAVGDDERRCGEMYGHLVSYLLTFPFKLAIGPVLDTFGTSAWENMERRIHLLFHSEDELVPSKITKDADNKHALAEIPASGGLSIFVQKLKERMKDSDWEVVLVGHSMGTMVLNELVRLYGDGDRPDDTDALPVSNIVYLAGAASIRDYEDSIFPYLKRHPETQFYNLVLHPISESSEMQLNFLDLPPRGSLLDWLDTFLADPNTLMDRTVGRYDNFLRTIHDTPNKLRRQVHFRSFSAGSKAEKNNPQSHSDAAERFRFWDPICWDVKASLDNCVRPLVSE